MFKDLKVSQRLVILIGVMLTALILNGMVAFYSYYTSKEAINELFYGGVNEINVLIQIESASEIGIANTVQKMNMGELSFAQGQSIIKNARNSIEESWKEYKNDKNFTSAEKKILNENLQNSINNSYLYLDRLDQILQENNKEALSNYAKKDLYGFVEPISKNISELINWHTEQTKSDFLHSNKIMNTNLFLIFTIILLSIILATLFGIYIARGISDPLKKSVDIINKLSKGNVNVEIDHLSNDEFGILFNAMKTMNESNKSLLNAVENFSVGDLGIKVIPRSENDTLSIALNKMITTSKNMSGMLTTISDGDLSTNVTPRSEKDELGHSFSKMTKNLREIIGGIQSEVNSLTSASQEILRSISQVASGSAETAAAVTETTTTVEELKQTAHVSDDKAKDVLISAEETLQIVQDSEKSLQNTLQDMHLISEKMTSISEGIIKLSEHSKAIGEIIDTVNDLAEQSNLLAVNAAIEAAKAGEQGKSFSVVAQEIRTLAEQSKAATVQVRSILNDIQNATSAAVLATEQGSKAVEKGVIQSSQTNESMQTLSKSITKVAQAANQIAISSQQQLVGVDQVTIAMNNINDATIQHVNNMKQIETAVQSLNDVGETLKEVTNRYNLSTYKNKKSVPKDIKNAYKMYMYKKTKIKNTRGLNV